MKNDAQGVSRRKILSLFVAAGGAPLAALIPASGAPRRRCRGSRSGRTRVANAVATGRCTCAKPALL